jgi:hypothetical protein
VLTVLLPLFDAAPPRGSDLGAALVHHDMSAAILPPLLIVEDDLALQKQIKWSLDRFECVTASDRESAWWPSAATARPW